jgi:hypothetical protein
MRCVLVILFLIFGIVSYFDFLIRAAARYLVNRSVLFVFIRSEGRPPTVHAEGVSSMPPPLVALSSEHRDSTVSTPLACRGGSVSRPTCETT